ncbi:unnamed protein product [Orchesella dallaii]|uniref:CCHC-type domain-containing protein n=1 Tax=Orchesella dallaii TaxID=48710 RepID=A0ABP1R5X0_9HEXA
MEPNSVAKELVDGYPQTAENYPVVIEALKEKFGRHDLLLQVYVRELLTLVISNVASKDKIPLAKLHLQLESHLRSLASLSLTNADPATWLFPLVESSLSEDTLRAWQRSNLSKEDGSKRTPPKSRLDLLMEFIRVEVQSEQQISLARSGFQQQSTVDPKKKSNAIKSHKNQDEDFPTAAGLFTAQNHGCTFCDKTHDSDRCVKALSMTLEERNNKVMEKNVCYRCLKPGHRSRNCKAVVRCAICDGKHYPVLCSGRNPSSSEKSNDSQTMSNTDQGFEMAPVVDQFQYHPGSASGRVPVPNMAATVTSMLVCTQKHLESSERSHVPGVANPAYFPPRRYSPPMPLESTGWEEPSFLKENRSSWPSVPLEINENEVLTETVKSTCNTVNVSMQEIPEPRCSSHRQNVAVGGWGMRFGNACRWKTRKKRNPAQEKQEKPSDLYGNVPWEIQM